MQTLYGARVPCNWAEIQPQVMHRKVHALDQPITWKLAGVLMSNSYGTWFVPQGDGTNIRSSVRQFDLRHGCTASEVSASHDPLSHAADDKTYQVPPL